MSRIEDLLAELSGVASNPKAQLDAHIEAGRKVVGVGPYYIPEEIVYAAGAIPFGVWGRMGTASKAREYFAPFYCSICQMTLEMGLNHELDKLSAMIVASLCDTQRGFSQNFRVGVTQVPMIFVSQPQNRSTAAGRAYAAASYEELRRLVGEAVNEIIDDERLHAAIKLHNEWRSAMRKFLALAGKRPTFVSVAARNGVVNAGYYMDKAEHLKLISELNELLAREPENTEGYKRVLVSGIISDIPAVMEALDEGKFAIVADDVAKESRALQMVVSETGDPIEALADGFCNVRNDSILYDADKSHIEHVVELARENDADGVVLLLAKFCDPEEFDQPLLVKACRATGLPIISVEVDQSTSSYEQARTQLETFAELI